MLILAGAGSGKTTVLINRIANLMRFGRGADTDEIPENATEEDISAMEAGSEAGLRAAAFEPVEPWRILAITFTNKAATELKNRLSAMLGAQAEDIWASTFHSCCVRILRRDADRLGFPTNFTIYDSSDSQSLIKHILKDLNYDEKTFAPRAVLSEISRAKDARISSEEYLKRANAAGDVWRRHMGEIYSQYMKRLFSAGAMDFDDLIAFTVKLLSEHGDVCEYWQNKFRYIMIDEYQDTNNLQYMLATLLAGGWGNICVVGDDDQSIYKFRGATIENILSFEDEYKHCRTIRLEQNYRSTETILEAANAVIRHNTARKGKSLWTNKAGGDPITVYTASDQDDESQFVAGQILAAFGGGSAFKDHAILYRMNAQANNLERALKRNGIPYRIVGGTRFFDRAEVKDMLAYLSVIASPGDDLRLSRIINTPARGIGAKTIETAQAAAAAAGKPLFEVISHADQYPELQRSGAKLRLFAIMIEELQAFSRKNTPDVLFDELVAKTGYVTALEAKNTVEDTARAENIKELKSSIVGYMKDSGDNSLEGFLADVALYTDLDNFDKDADGVVLMTMHSAKGLEFPTVFVVGAEEGIFTGIRAIGEQEEMEEERRLCYVAITRAKKKLFITCAKQRMLFGHTSANKASRFLDEIPDEFLEKRQSYRTNGYERPRDASYASFGGGVSYDRGNYNGSYGSSYGGSRRNDGESAYGSSGGSGRGCGIKAPGEGPAARAPVSAPLPDYRIGDGLTHKAFGRGIVTAMRPMGNDCLIEIEFEGAGSKKLMLRTAAQHMTKD